MASGQVQTTMSGEINATTLTGSDGQESQIFIAPTKCTIVGIDLVNNAAVTVQETNYGTLTVYNKGATGSGTTSVGTRVTNAAGGGALGKDNPAALTLTSNITMAKSDGLTVGWAEAAGSLDLTRATLAIHWVTIP